ncbi:MAG: hypothetical protein WCD70_16905 [Alphaproteobacteria bacterium]
MHEVQQRLISLIMADNAAKNPWDDYEATLVKTQARRGDLRDKFEKKDEELRVLEEKLVRTIEVLKDIQATMASVADDAVDPRRATAAQPSTETPTQPGQPQPIGPDSPFYGKSLPECAVIIIRQAGRALTEAEIVDALRAGGVQIVSKMPQMNVRRSMARRPDILQNRNRKWVVIETPSDGEKLPPKRVVNNFTTAHAESTRKGIAAAQARGVVVGRTPLITTEKEKVILEMRSQGSHASEIANAIGVSRTAYFNYLREKGWTKQYAFHDISDQPEEDNLR